MQYGDDLQHYAPAACLQHNQYQSEWLVGDSYRWVRSDTLASRQRLYHVPADHWARRKYVHIGYLSLRRAKPGGWNPERRHTQIVRNHHIQPGRGEHSRLDNHVRVPSQDKPVTSRARA